MAIPAFGKAYADEMLLPAKPPYVALSFFVAFMLNMLPLAGWVLMIRPDFVAVVLLYWGIQHPRAVGFTPAFLLGLAMDVTDGSLFGQHALAYSILAYAGIVLHRRVQRFSMAPQILHVIPLLLLTSLIVLLVRALAGADFPGYAYFLGSFTGAALWPMLSYLLKLPQRPRPDPDRV